MTALDPVLAGRVGEKPWERADRDWDHDRAYVLAASVAGDAGLAVESEPPDEEWVSIVDERGCHGLVSTLFPLVLALPDVAARFRERQADLAVVEFSDYHAADLSASPEVLRGTLLRNGWAEDFDPAAFSASDLFVESV